jgi:hypothetical protein
MTLTNEPHFGFPAKRFEPRATRIPITHRDDIDVEIWVGGSDTALGDEIEMHHLEGAWLIDCAGEMTPAFREAAIACFPRVFADLEVLPSNIDRLRDLARDIGARIRGEAAEALAEHESPVRVFVMCSQGFNRSGLMAGLILREIGASPEEIVLAIRGARPGALSNETFVRLLSDPE